MCFTRDSNLTCLSVDATQIFVKLVNDQINEDQLIEVFTKVGSVKSCSISRARNCAFVDFYSPESCQKALAQHKFPVHGHTVLAEERRYNNQNNNQNQNRYNNNNQNRNNQNTPFEQRRSNNTNNQSNINRRGQQQQQQQQPNANNNNQQQNRQNQGGKGRGAPNSTNQK